jgi:hypothetical protein
MTHIEFVMECQKLLLVHSGWDWKTFLSIIDCVVMHRVNTKEALVNQPSLSWQFEQINRVFEQWLEDDGEDLEKYLKEYNDGELFSTFEKLKTMVNNKP